jgi:hypothetical protein
VLGGMSSVILATLWLTARLASIERSIMDLRLLVTKDFATNTALDELERRISGVEQRNTALIEWRASTDRRLAALEASPRGRADEKPRRIGNACTQEQATDRGRHER